MSTEEDWDEYGDEPEILLTDQDHREIHGDIMYDTMIENEIIAALEELDRERHRALEAEAELARKEAGLP